MATPCSIMVTGQQHLVSGDQVDEHVQTQRLTRKRLRAALALRQALDETRRGALMDAFWMLLVACVAATAFFWEDIARRRPPGGRRPRGPATEVEAEAGTREGG
jgi:hypothetical protein